MNGSKFISEPVVSGTAPSNLAITVALAKTYLEIDASDTHYDALVQDAIEAATIEAQNATGLQLSRASFIGYLSAWPSLVRVSLPPLVSVTSVKYYDATNTLSSAIDASNYAVSPNLTPGIITFSSEFSQPALYDRPDAIEITFVAGYESYSAIPADIRKGVRLLVWNEFEFRKNGVREKTTEADIIFAQYKGSGL